MNLLFSDHKRYATRRLHQAIELGEHANVKKWLADGAIVYERDVFDHIISALHLALQHNQEKCLKTLLLHEGIDINVFDMNGQTPLAMAARLDKPYLKIFVDRGADVNLCAILPRNPMNTALHYAVMNNNLDNVKYLIRCGADVNRVNSIGETALIMAARDCKRFLCAEALLDANCDIHVRHRDATALETARCWQNYEFVGMFNAYFSHWTRRAHDRLRDAALALAPLDLPDYVLMWILDWLPEFTERSELRKIGLLRSVRASRTRVLAARADANL